MSQNQFGMFFVKGHHSTLLTFGFGFAEIRC